MVGLKDSGLPDRTTAQWSKRYRDRLVRSLRLTEIEIEIEELAARGSSSPGGLAGRRGRGIRVRFARRRLSFLRGTFARAAMRQLLNSFGRGIRPRHAELIRDLEDLAETQIEPDSDRRHGPVSFLLCFA